MDKSNPITYLFRKTWHYSAGNRKRVALYWTMFVIANAFSLILTPLIFAKMFNMVQQEGITPDNFSFLVWLLFLTVVVGVVFWVLHGPARVLEEANAFKARATYKKYLLKGVMTLPVEWQSEHHSGDTIDRIEKGTSALYSFSSMSFQMVALFVQLIVSYAMLIYFSSPAAYIVLSMVLLTGWIIIRFDRFLIKRYGELNRAENGISESVYDAVGNIATVIILRVEYLIFEAIAKKIDKPFDLFNRTNRINEVKWFLMNTLCNIMIAVVLGVYFYQNMGTAQNILVGNMMGSMFILIKYLEKIRELFFLFASEYGDIVKHKTRVINAEYLSNDFVTENFTNHVLPARWQRLDVRDLNFSYHGEDGDLHLENISLSLAKGERIALVGESGGGKTTFMKIMRDLYHPQNVHLYVDGRFIPEGFGGISRAIALVPQDPEIFATTIRENITIGAEYNMDFVLKFTDMACFTDVAEDLPHKFDSSVKEKGVNLSGGQQQRLALARGLLACHDKDVVLLDEPTSSVDTANEMKIYCNIFKAFRDKTIVSSVHRLHLLPMFDKIYFFSREKIAASGNLNELLSCCVEFRELWQKYNVEFSPTTNQY